MAEITVVPLGKSFTWRVAVRKRRSSGVIWLARLEAGPRLWPMPPTDNPMAVTDSLSCQCTQAVTTAPDNVGGYA